MHGKHSDGFLEAMWLEINTLLKKDAWIQVPHKAGMKVLWSIWAFKIKRFPTGLIKKLKACFCAGGDLQQHGIDVFETYAPVVSWTTVCLLMILSIFLNLQTCQVDYTAAFVQVDFDTDVFLEPPRGWCQLNKWDLLNLLRKDMS